MKRMTCLVLASAMAIVLMMPTDAEAGLFRRGGLFHRVVHVTKVKSRGCTQYVPAPVTPPPSVPLPMPKKVSQSAAGECENVHCVSIQSDVLTWATPVGTATDALAELNAARQKRGLHPYQHDPDLTKGALACAEYRAARRIAGHCSNDFAFLPSGTRASAAGCAALEPSWGWQSCCAWERWQYAGAAWAMGNDGRRYMHLFVR